MPFITQGKTNWKFLLIVIILAIIVCIGVLWYAARQERPPTSVELPKTEQKSTQELGCINSGGTVSTSSCCDSSNDFPNSCLIGACGCSSDNSHQVKTCNCGESKCFDGEKCVSQETTRDETADWKTYRNEEYGFEFKYPNKVIGVEPEILPILNENKELGGTVLINFPNLITYGISVDVINKEFNSSFITNFISDKLSEIGDEPLRKLWNQKTVFFNGNATYEIIFLKNFWAIPPLKTDLGNMNGIEIWYLIPRKDRKLVLGLNSVFIYDKNENQINGKIENSDYQIELYKSVLFEKILSTINFLD
jgi:hypothetical protein